MDTDGKILLKAETNLYVPKMDSANQSKIV
jgi:hypothetical protein